MVRPFGYLGGKRTDQMLPPALARPASIYPLGGADVAHGAALVREGAVQADEARLLHGQHSCCGRGRAQTLAFNLKQIGIDLEVKYFSISTPSSEKAATPGEPFDLVILGWAVDYADAATFFVPLLGRDGISAGINLDDARLQRRHRCGEPPDG